MQKASWPKFSDLHFFFSVLQKQMITTAATAIAAMDYSMFSHPY